MVRVCHRCETEHPREGNYTFSEATREIQKVCGHITRSRR
jgi:hypothetical protein